MWSEALSVLDRAERLQRRFFTHAAAAWEPPVDLVETADALLMQVALPGVAADSIAIGLDPDGVTIAASRPFPCRGESRHIHRIEIPYGRFERRIGLVQGELLLVKKTFADGILTLTFKRKEGA
jgi:HSP20 family molecular chaperone IbpA